MTNYHEDRRAYILETLQAHYANVRLLKSLEKKSLLSLHTAQGALMDTSNNLLHAKKQLDDSTVIKQTAMQYHLLSQNLLTSANEVYINNKLSVTNTAAAAANLQTAANSIVQLAADISSLFNILSAADTYSGFMDIAGEVHTCINETASAAESASQTAMEAAVSTAQISSAALLQLVKNNQEAADELLKQGIHTLKALEQRADADTAAFGINHTNEQRAQGDYKDRQNNTSSAKNACYLANKALNLGLKAVPVIERREPSFSITFYLLNSPFKQEETAAYYPVKAWYLFFVRAKEQVLFSKSNAADILNNADQQKRYIPLNGLMNLSVAADGENKFSHTFNSRKISLPGEADFVLQDTEGNDIETGTAYVVFLLAVYQDSYKKRLNDWDDYLSAPSDSFCLVTQLAAASFNQPMEKPLQKRLGTNVNVIKSIFFTVQEDPAIAVEYRCIFLPAGEIDLHFNLDIAGLVGAGNYILVEGAGTPVTIPGTSTAVSEWEVKIHSDAADCFGNLLTPGHSYIPVIFSVAAVKQPELPKYSNACTNYKQTALFTFNWHN
jgi:hypothetical protein